LCSAPADPVVGAHIAHTPSPLSGEGGGGKGKGRGGRWAAVALKPQGPEGP